MTNHRTRLVSALIATTAALLTLTAGSASAAVNDWNCKPTAAHPEPVVLVHGLGANADANWFYHAPKLEQAGHCTFALSYGKTAFGGGTADMRASAAELGAFVDQVLAATGATKVNIVGHSEGTTVPAYYLKRLGGAAKVKRFVGFGSNFKGTTLGGLSILVVGLGRPAGLATYCPACDQFMPGSDFMNDLNAGGVTVPGPKYTTIVSKADVVVTPYTSGLLSGNDTTNIVLQDACPLDYSGHLGLAVDPNVSNLILRALDPVGGPARRCVPFASGF